MIRTFLSALGLAAVVQGATQSVTVCSAGECLTGNSNITRLGAVLSASTSGSYILLPGQYTSSVQPASLEQALVSATSTLVFTTGFGNSTSPTTPSLPLNIALQPGLLNYPNDLYSGDPTFLGLPQNVNGTFNSTAINRGSIILSANTVAAIQANNNGAKNRVVLWDTVPYISQLPYDMAGNLEVVSLQSTLCSPTCSNSAICSTSGTCICKPNFTGDSCEQCADGHFGPDCTPCPTGCSNCDAGITGTGACLSVQLPSNAPQNCNCGHGTCSGSTCTCASGWATSTSGGNSTQCNTCAEGFFLDSNGNCSACGARCQACSANTGTCTQCDNNSLTPGAGGNPLQCSQTTTCATNEFLSGTTCTRCNGACASCFGPGATDCLLCAGNNILLNGQCVPVSLTSGAAGICSGSSLVANRAKGVCDVCPLGCANCAYDAFDQQSTQYSSVKCTKCLPGKFLSGGNCVDTCPDGTFAASDGTCSACSSSCATCIGTATTCLTCKNSQLASAGTCVSTCPTNSFSSAGKCTSCHPDCATCSGPGFNQCLTCPDSNPVFLGSKRCVTTCAKNQYYDEGSGSCTSCDSSCATCSSGGSNSCLSCASNTQVLRAGKCSSVNFGNGAGPTSGLGVCLAELVQVPGNSGSPPTSIPPIDPNSQQPTSGGGHKLTWWQILLIVLGALLLLAIILILWRRRQRKKRAQQTEQFKQNMKHQGLWSKLFRNPFSAWWARRRAAAINRRSRSDLERRTEKDWRNTQSEPYTPGTFNNHSPGLSSGERRPAVGVPRSIGHTSWITMGQQDGRSFMTGPNNAGLGLGAIRERDEGDRYTTRSGRSAKDSYRSRRDDMRYGDEYRRGESQLWGQEIDQDDSRSERTRTDQTYLRSGVTGDPYQFDRPSSRSSDNQTDLVSIIKSEGVSERWDDRDRRQHGYERSRSGYERSERSRAYDERSYRTRDRDYPRQDYPASVSTQSQSRSYDRDRRGFGSSSASHSHGPDTPSMYSQPTLPRIPPHAAAFDEPPRDAVLSSRFSMSTTAASTRPPPKRKQVPQEPMPLNLPPRQLTDAEMYKMSKVFPDLFGLLSPTKKSQSPPATTAVKSPSRNPFRI